MLRKKDLWFLGVFAAVALGAGACSDDDSGTECGDGVREGTEVCDGTDLGTATCVTLGHTGGTLACDADCNHVTTGCTDTECNNGQRETGEECDGADLASATCQSRGYDTGTLACSSSCTFDESDCQRNCGNGTLDVGTETCDGSALGTDTCATQGFDRGTLACAADCSAFVTTGCCDDTCPAGATICSGDTLRVCEIQANGCLGITDTDCTATGLVCDDSGATAVCAQGCSDSCTAGATMCTGNLLSVCETQGNGCLGYTVTDCAANGGVCDDSSSPAVCYTPCTSDCNTVGEYRCNANNVEICATNGDCLNWTIDTQCGLAGACTTLPSGTQCVPSGDGDTCATAMFVATAYTTSGSDFTADFANDQTWTGNTGCGTANGAEAVFQVWLNAGDSVHYVEAGGLDAVVRVVATCDATAACLASNDYGEDRFYEATSAGFYYVVIEAYSSTPYTLDYDILVEVLPPETICDDGVDNDQDALVDCADPNCFGVAPACSTETHCGDGEDNDGDTLVDCLDTDCAASLPCQTRNGVWQIFSSTDQSDVAGCTISFTPNGLDYQWSSTCPGHSTLPELPGGGSTSTVIPTASWTDDNFVPYTLATSWDFPFFGQGFGAFFIGSNGFLTFDTGDSYHNSTESGFYEFPRIAPYDADLDPRDGTGQVTVDEYADRVVVSFVDVMYYSATSPNTFQVVLYQNGDIDFHYTSLLYLDSVSIGIGNGAAGTAPAQVDFVPPPPPSAGDVIFSEIMFNPDVLDDAVAEWLELYNRSAAAVYLAGCTITHAGASFTVPVGTSLEAGGYLVVARNADPLVNGGIVGAIEWTGMVLGNANTSLKDYTLTCASTTIDTVDFGNTTVYPAGGPGISIQLDSTATASATENDDPANWCDADSADLYHPSNAGTPGEANRECGVSILLDEGFDTWPPAGWTIENLGGAATWVQCSACGDTLTGSTGAFAMVDSDAAGGESFDDSLQSPSFDCAGYSACTLSFIHYYNDYSANDSAAVEISISGGAWTPLLTYTADTANGAVASVPLTGAAGNADVRVRFHYVSGYDWYWRIDSVLITCSL